MHVKLPHPGRSAQAVLWINKKDQPEVNRCMYNNTEQGFTLPQDINWRDAELSFMPRAKSHISTNWLFARRR